MTCRRDRWIGAIPCFPTEDRVWVTGPSGAMKPIAARTPGLFIWIGLGLFVAAIVVLTGWGLLRLVGVV